MGIFKIIFIGIVGAFVYLYLKNNNSELSGLSVIATGILILILSVGYITDTVQIFKTISVSVGISPKLFVLIIKIVVISYLCDFTCSFCEDVGVKSIADKVNFASKIIIFVLSAPIIMNVFEVISSLIV